MITGRRSLTNVWWLVLLQGIISLVLGLLLVISPGMTTSVLVGFLGIYWLVNGIFTIVGIFVGDSAMPWGWLLLSGLIGILAGILVLNHPLLSTILVPTLLVVIIGIQGIIVGVIGLLRALIWKDGWWAFILGVVNILIGVLLLGSPLLAALVLVLVIGVSQLINGMVLIVLSLRMRGAWKEMIAST